MNTDCAVIWSLSYADINMYVGGKIAALHRCMLQRLGKQKHKKKDEAWIKDEEIMFHFYSTYCSEYKTSIPLQYKASLSLYFNFQ